MVQSVNDSLLVSMVKDYGTNMTLACSRIYKETLHTAGCRSTLHLHTTIRRQAVSYGICQISKNINSI